MRSSKPKFKCKPLCCSKVSGELLTPQHLSRQATEQNKTQQKHHSNGNITFFASVSSVNMTRVEEKNDFDGKQRVIIWSNYGVLWKKFWFIKPIRKNYSPTRGYWNSVKRPHNHYFNTAEFIHIRHQPKHAHTLFTIQPYFSRFSALNKQKLIDAHIGQWSWKKFQFTAWSWPKNSKFSVPSPVIQIWIHGNFLMKRRYCHQFEHKKAFNLRWNTTQTIYVNWDITRVKFLKLFNHFWIVWVHSHVQNVNFRSLDFPWHRAQWMRREHSFSLLLNSTRNWKNFFMCN